MPASDPEPPFLKSNLSYQPAPGVVMQLVADYAILGAARRGAAMGFNRLSWGVKASFRSYVEAAGGSIDLSDGATRAEDGSFVFRAVPGGDLAIASDGSATGAMRFQGKITFDAHGGMLKATLSELGLEAGTDGLVLTALEAPMNKKRCTIAELSVIEVDPDNTVTLGAQITSDGMYQIADNYPPGTELDPLRLD